MGSMILASWGSRGGQLGYLLGRLGGFSGRLEAIVAVLDCLAISGLSWTVLGPSWDSLGPSWGPLGPSRGHLGSFCMFSLGGPRGTVGRVGPYGSDFREVLTRRWRIVPTIMPTTLTERSRMARVAGGIGRI